MYSKRKEARLWLPFEDKGTNSGVRSSMVGMAILRNSRLGQEWVKGTESAR